LTHADSRVLHILLVEDDDVDVMNVKRAFQKNNLSNPITVANNGVEALEKLRDGTVPSGRRLVLLDLNMPKMNGIEFLRELRKDPQLRPTPVVVLTTSSEEKDKIEAYDLNVAGYLLKPVKFMSFVDLMAALNKYWTLVEMP
jgi:CheY-like chemotaxis protein